MASQTVASLELVVRSWQACSAPNDRNQPKAILDKFKPSPADRQRFDKEIQRLTIIHEFSLAITNIAAGESVSASYVVHLCLRDERGENVEREIKRIIMDITKALETVTIALNCIKGFAKYLLIPSGAITFLPEKWLSYMRLLDFKNSLGSWIAGVFFLSLSIVVINFISRIAAQIKTILRHKRERQNLERLLFTLTFTEKRILKELFDNDSACFSINDASVNKLERLHLIMRPNIGLEFTYFSYTLQPCAYEYFCKHPEFFNEVTLNE